MRLAEVVICKVERDRRFKALNLFAESVCQSREATAMHPQSVVLFFDMACCDSANVWESLDYRPFGFNHFGRAVPTRRILVEIGDCVGFYQLRVIHLTPKATLNRVRICVE